MRRHVARYFIKFLFAGRAEALVYQVDEETSDRIRRHVSGIPRGFCCFTTLDGREVAINLACLDYVHFLWDAALSELSVVERWPASIYFSGRHEAFCCDPEDGDEAFGVFFALDTDGSHADPFMTLTDEDGEAVVFDARHIDAIEMSAGLVAEGAAKLDEEPAGDSRMSDD